MVLPDKILRRGELGEHAGEVGHGGSSGWVAGKTMTRRGRGEKDLGLVTEACGGLLILPGSPVAARTMSWLGRDGEMLRLRSPSSPAGGGR